MKDTAANKEKTINKQTINNEKGNFLRKGEKLPDINSLHASSTRGLSFIPRYIQMQTCIHLVLF